MERMPLGQPPSEKGTTMTIKAMENRLAFVEAMINDIINLGLSDDLEQRLDALVEEAQTLKEQLNK